MHKHQVQKIGNAEVSLWSFAS